jgi:4-amino-4-deoxy-L-arabinose transferase-like glycosyltransferase
MPAGGRLGAARLALVGVLAAATLVPGLGHARRLSYHEAFVAQAAREMIAGGSVVVPTIAGRPWLEKPPLAVWLVALGGRLAGGVSEPLARAPMALAGALAAVGVAVLAAGRFGPTVGLLAGLVQATTLWTLVRGRLAEADMLLAALVVFAVLAFDRLREEPEGGRGWWRWAFFAALGGSALAKGIGFGGVLVAAAVALVVVWDRDRRTVRRLRFGPGWVLAGVLALAWPAAVLVQYPAALRLWSLHVLDRLAARPEHFASGPWWQYGPALLYQALPWTPLALVGAWRSLGRSVTGRGRGGGDRLLWAWAVAPVALLSLATVKNAHYAIYALPPWSVWAALSLARLGERLQGRGWTPARLRRAAWVGFGTLALACGLAFAILAPWFDRRGVEWAFYEDAGRRLRPGEPLVLLYDDWDRAPYYTPFGPVPHDLAIRLYYFRRPASWRDGPGKLVEAPPAEAFAVLARARDLPSLRRLGRVETVLQGPTLRSSASRVDDRTFVLYRVDPAPDRVALQGPAQGSAPPAAATH